MTPESQNKANHYLFQWNASIDEMDVKLKIIKTDKIHTIPLNRLSKEDQYFIQQWPQKK